MHRRFAYNELDQDDPVIVTDTDILRDYYLYWSREMLKHGGLSPRITPENCIEDFVVVNWAWELHD